MTVGISLINHKLNESITVTDARESYENRQSNSASKLTELDTNLFNGVVYGTGNGDTIKLVHRKIEEITRRNYNKGIESFVEKIFNYYGDREEKFKNISTKHIKSETINKLRIVPLSELRILLDREKQKNKKNNPNDKSLDDILNHLETYVSEKIDGILDNSINKALKDYNEYQKISNTELVFILYDKQKKTVRSFISTLQAWKEIFTDHIEVGSGNDGANFYLINQLQGVNLNSDIQLNTLLFYAINAYNYSTLNQGVGGTPTVTLMKADKRTTLLPFQVKTLVNLSGIYLARLDEVPLKTSQVKDYYRKVINTTSSSYTFYSDLADELGLNKQTLTGLTIPYSSWQESSTLHLFSRNK
ncbi:MAG: hypothetical protein GWP09_02925 [Nitrospiraceae bacterium]|nr:hypothetical protein [Nitrospiraceae bacterium]